MIKQENLPFYLKLDENSNFSRYGYEIFSHPYKKEYTELQKYFTQYLHDALVAFLKKHKNDANGADILQKSDFTLAKYHLYLEKFGINHHDFIKVVTHNLPNDAHQQSYLKSLITIASEKFKTSLSIYEGNIEFRVVRPNQSDNNPLHRDHWFPYFIPLINIYLPLSGNHCDSAMKIVPFSLRWSDEEVKPTFNYGEGKKTVKEGVAYSVPEIAYCAHEIKPHRPDIVEGDFMLFSPLLVHGGGDNFSVDTSFSFEIRLEPMGQK